MAKKKKFGAILEKQTKQIPVVKQKAPKTISTNVSTDGMRSAVSSTTQSVAKSARQKAEEERSARMRQGLSSVVRSSFNRQMSRPTYINKNTVNRLNQLNKTVTNPLAPIKQKQVTGGNGVGEQRLFSKERSLLNNTKFVTGGQGVGGKTVVNSQIGRAKSSILAPIKEDIQNNPYDAVRKVGMKGSRNERKVYVPLSQRDENGQISTNQRRLENAARGGNRKAQVEAALARTKAQTLSGHTYDQYVNAELNKKGLLGQDYILRGKDPTQEALDYRQRYGFDEEALNQIKAIADNAPENGGNGRSVLDRLKFGFDESWRARNIEDTYERQYGKPIDEDTQAQLDSVRDSGGYMVGNMLGQASQFAMTAPYSGILEGSLMARMGLKGGRAAINTTADALKYAGARIGADQILSAPINLLDAMKEDNVKDIVKRFGMNSGMDIIFGGLIEIPAFRKNYKFVKAIKANDAANAMEAGAEKTAAKVSAQKQLSKAIDSMDEQTKRQIVLRLNETAENARIQRAMDFKNDAELLFQDGYVASRDAVNASVEHGIAEADSYEWQVAYDAARRNGADEEDAIEFADASLEDAIANNHVRQPRETEVDRASETLSNVETPSDTLARAQAQADADDVLLNARREADNNTGIIGANERPMPTQEERGTYGQDVIARDRRRLYNQEEIRYLRDRERPRNAYEEDLWNEEFERVLRENYGSSNAEDRAFAAADRAVAVDRETRLINARERIKNKENLERVRERAKAKEQAKEKTRGQEIADRLAKEKQARQSAEEVVETAEKATNTNSVDDVIKAVNSNDHIGYTNGELQSARAKLENALRDDPMNADAEDAIDAIDQELYRRDEEPQWDIIEPRDRSTENAMPREKAEEPKTKTEQPKAETKSETKTEQPKAASEPKKKEIDWERERKRYKEKDNDALEKEKKKIRNKVSKGTMDKDEGSRRIDLINDVMDSKKQRDLDLEDKIKAKEKGWGDPNIPKQKHGAPAKNSKGEDLSQATASSLQEGQTRFGKDTRDEARRRATEENSDAYIKKGRGFDKNLESAKARYDSDAGEFESTLEKDIALVKDGNLPQHRNTMQDFFDDVAYMIERNEEAMKGLDKNSAEYSRMVSKNADLVEGAIQGGSQMGYGLNHYKIFADSTDAVKDKLINRNLDNLEGEFQKRLKKIGKTELDFPDELRLKIKKAKTAEEASEAWAEASVYVWNQIPASLKEKIDFIRINSMLLNPTTHIRNILGNAMFVPLRGTKNIVGTAMEIGAEKLGIISKSERTKAVRLVQEYMDYGQKILDQEGDVLRGASRFFENISSKRPMKGADTFKDIFDKNAVKSSTFMAGRENGNPIINGFRKFADTVGDFNSWALEHEDFKFFNPAFKKQLSRTMSARGVTVEDMMKNAKLRDDIIEVATEEALRATYRDESALAKAISGMKNPRKNAGPIRKLIGVALDSIFPFTKTPINIVRRALDYSPVGAIKGTVNFWRGVAHKDAKLIVKGIDEFASFVPGTGIAAAGFLLAKHDKLTGKLGDDDADKFMKDLGKQNFSVRFHLGGDREVSFTLDWAAPACIPFFTGAHIYEVAKGNGFSDINWWEVADLVEQMLEPTTEMSVLQGFRDTLESFSNNSSNGDKITQGLFLTTANAGLNYVNQIIHPTLVSKVARTIDPVRRDTSSNADSQTQRIVEKWLNKQIAGTPFLSKKLNPYQNAWAEDQRNTFSKNPAMRIVENFVLPGYLKEYNPDSVDKKLLEMMEKDPSASGLLPEKNWKGEVSFDGGTVKLEKDEINQYNKEYAKSKQGLKKLFGTSDFKNASLSEQEKQISNLYTDYKANATKEILLKKGFDEWKVRTDNLSDSKKDYKAAKDAGITAKQYEYYATTKDWDRSGNGSAYKSEAVLFLNSQDLTDEQRAVLFPLYSTAKNPYLDGTAHTKDWEAQYKKDLANTDKKDNKKETETFSEASKRSGGVGSNLFNTTIDNKLKKLGNESNSSGSSGGGRRGRSGRSGGGGGGGSKKARAKTASEKRFAALQKMQAPTTGKGIEALAGSAKGLTKAQKKALLKLMQKKLDV